ARSIGGCPSNDTGTRFKTISILTTATQLSFVADVCGPAGTEGAGVPAVNLLPPGMDPNRALDSETAAQILAYQTGVFFSRDPNDWELQIAAQGGVTPVVPDEERDG